MLSEQSLETFPFQDMRLLHTMLRIIDLDRSVKFYTELLGMKLLRQKDYPDGEFTLAFLGYGNEANNTVLELTHNWNTSGYEKGNAFGHIAIAVKHIYQACQHLRERGVEIVREPGPMKNDRAEVIAFIIDPDGYQIELIERE